MLAQITQSLGRIVVDGPGSRPERKRKLLARVWSRGNNVQKLILSIVLATAVPCWGQFSYPASASTDFAVVQLADGGPVTQHWTTTVILANPNLGTAASVRIRFYNDAGQPLALDFGQGPVSTLNLVVPAGGSITLTSTGASTPPVLSAWARVQSDYPITGTVLYSATQNGTPLWDVAALGTERTFYYNSYANASLGIAVANRTGGQTLHLKLTARDSSGVSRGVYTIPALNPSGHAAFNLSTVIPGLPAGFEGTITIEPTDNPLVPFVAWSVNVHNGLLSPLPPGGMLSPRYWPDRFNNVSALVGPAVIGVLTDAGVNLIGANPAQLASIIMGLGLTLDSDLSLKASFNAGDNTIHASVGLAEALGSSEAALGFLLVHMGVHGVFAHTGVPTTGPFANDAEGAADALATLSLLRAGYDPYGAAEFYSHLLYATAQNLSVDATLQNEFGVPNSIPAHLQKLGTNVHNVCAMSAGLTQICEKAREYWHPDNPAGVP
jgi:hypothetical protein